MDDNSPTKNDTKDARVISQLIKDGRYSVPNLLDGIYAELREGVKVRDQLIDQLMITEGRIQNVVQRYFPEFFDVFKNWEGKAALCTLKIFPFPSDIKKMTPEEVFAKWKPFVQRGVGGVGIKKATKLVETAKKSIGIQIGIQFAKREMDCLLEQYELYTEQLKQLDQELESLVENIPGAKGNEGHQRLRHNNRCIIFR